MRTFVIRIRAYRDFQLEVEAEDENKAIELADQQRRFEGLESWDEIDDGELTAEIIYEVHR